MVRRIEAVIDDMLGAVEGIERATAGRTLQDFSSDWLLRHGVQRGIEIVSEAARHLPDDILDRQPTIPWDRVKGIGNVLRHEYHKVADDILWAVVVRDLPPLKSALLAIRKSLST